MAAANGAALIGRTANIKASHEYYGGHWGTITAYDGSRFTISGGSIGDTLAPVFNRSEFTVPKRAAQARRTRCCLRAGHAGPCLPVETYGAVVILLGECPKATKAVR